MYDTKFLASHTGRIPLAKRLSDKTEIREDGCHVFTGGKDTSGYGRMKVGPAQLGAHKVSYLLNVGDYDQTGMELMHTCDNPACVNPDHITPAPHRQNMLDAIQKGRHKYRENFKLADVANPSSRQIAMAEGRDTYHGSECKKHGATERHVTNGACMICRREYTRMKTEQRRAKRG